MAETTEHLLQECAACGALIDVSEEQPFALMHCPRCGVAVRVRRQFGNFEVQEILGSGGMGAVYRALDVNLHRQVALKLLRKEYSENPEFIQQFAHEAAITALVNHPNVVKVYSSGSDNGLFYIAMELVDKGSLDDLITLQGRVGELQVLSVGIQIAQGLNAAFERGLIHRDVKPGNILFADAHNAKIVDFGLAVPMTEAGTLGGEIWGTPYYVAPEKLDHKPEDFRSDMYSLSASLFHALAGRPPYEAEDASVVALKHLKSQAVSLQSFAPDVSGETGYVINRAMHKIPDQRYASYNEFVEHLAYAKSELEAKSVRRRASQKVVVEQQQSRRATSWVTLGLITALALGAGALFLFKDQIFGSGSPAKSTPTTVAVSESVEKAYQNARQELIAGDYDSAAKSFRKLATADDTPEPMRSWAGLHCGLAWMLAGKVEKARYEWQALTERGAFSPAPENQKLAAFFLDTARKAAADEAPAADIAAHYSTANYEVLAVLIFAAKLWVTGHPEQAAPLFRAFESAVPEGGNSWVAEYKPIASGYLTDLAEYNRALEQATSAQTLEQQKAAVSELKATRSRLKIKGALITELDKKVSALEETTAAREEEQSRKQAADQAEDARLLAAARAKATPLAQQYRFSDARVAFAAAPAKSEKGKRDKDALMKRVEWLAQFKTQLIRDLTTNGYSAPITTKVGGQLPAGTAVSRASESQLETTARYGIVPVPWTDLAPDCVFQMARSFVRPDLGQEKVADRQWLLGIYALFIGKKNEGRALLTEAAQAKSEYRDQLTRILEPGE